MSSVVRLSDPVMGTVASVHVVARERAADAVAAAGRVFGELRRLERIFTTFASDSEVMRISRGELNLLDASSEVIEVMDACTWLEHESNGVFVARRPDGGLDPAGFVKGWAAQRASALLTEAGFEDWFVGVGGDIQTSGSNELGAGWSVGIIDPVDAERVMCTLELSGMAIATSGTTARGMHIWNRSGEFVNPFASISVVGPELKWADAFATTAFAMGHEGLAWVEKYDGYHAIAVDHAGQLVAPAWSATAI